MTENYTSKKFSDKGLETGSSAPNILSKDIYGDPIDLRLLLKENDFVLIDFFRGAW